MSELKETSLPTDDGDRKTKDEGADNNGVIQILSEVIHMDRRDDES